MKSPWPKINGLKLFFAAKSDSADKVWMECMKSDAVIAVHRHWDEDHAPGYMALYCRDESDQVRLARNAARRAVRRMQLAQKAMGATA